MSYISSSDNRLYVSKEQSYGDVPAITDHNRFPAVKLAARQTADKVQRRDKTGGRTWFGVPTGTRKNTTFELRTYLTGWTEQPQQPGYGPLFEAEMGGAAVYFGGGTVSTAVSPTRLRLSSTHGLESGTAIASAGELRFVAAIVDEQTVELNAPFSIQPAPGSPIGPTLTYKLGSELPSVSIFDYWSPAEAIHRVINGSAADQFKIRVNGDFHEFEFRGGASDILDSASFSGGEGGLAEFPSEPPISPYNYTVVPGHLGQVWLGSTPERVHTLTHAEITLDNGIDYRNREFGSNGPRSVVPGRRTVTADFHLYQQNTDAMLGLYQAARQKSPIEAMFQLGQQEGQLFAAYLKSVVPEIPQFDDSDPRLKWQFVNCRAQGVADDEMVIAFG